MRVDRISINKNKLQLPLREGALEAFAVPVYIETNLENQVIGHRVIEGEHQGTILTTDKYVVIQSGHEFVFDDEKIIEELVPLINRWELQAYGDKTRTEDMTAFAKDLLNYFKSRL